MEYTEAHEKLLASAEFKEWHAKNADSYLAHFFAQLDQNLRPSDWEIGYYDAKADSISTFAVGDPITVKQDKVFKKEATIEKLDVENVKLDADTALRAAREFQLKQYPQHPSVKGFMILQSISFGLVWNITFITQTFAALNIKVDAVKGEIVHHHLATFFDFRAQ